MERNDFLEQYLYNDSDRLALAEQVAQDYRKALFFTDKIKLQAVLDALLVGISYSHPEDKQKRLWDHMEGVVLIPESIMEAGRKEDELLESKGLTRQYNFEVQVQVITNPTLSGVEFGSWLEEDEDGFPDPDDTVVFFRLKARPHLYVTEKFGK